MILAAEHPPGRPFQFERDTFAHANELFWEYPVDPATGKTTTLANHPPPTYAHRCFVMVRSARQFYYHARFEPGQPVAGVEVYRRIIREVVSRNPRRASAQGEKIVVPGYDCLRSFSQAHEGLMKAECGGPWASYFLRSHWRMVFPVWARHQERMALQLREALRDRPAPIVHVFRFPRITINHGIVLYGATETGEGGVQFDAYDPNIPAHPVKLIFDPARRGFWFPPAHYWAGGQVSVIEIFRGGLY